MGMFDWVDYVCDCPKCGNKVDGFQSKSAYNQLIKLKPWEVSNFYSSCRNCQEWIEFKRTDIEDYNLEHITPPEPYDWKSWFNIESEIKTEILSSHDIDLTQIIGLIRSTNFQNKPAIRFHMISENMITKVVSYDTAEERDIAFLEFADEVFKIQLSKKKYSGLY